MQETIITLLKRLDVLDNAQVARVLASASQSGGSLAQHVVRVAGLEERFLANLLEKQFQLVRLESFIPALSPALHDIPHALLRTLRCVPMGLREGFTLVAVDDPSDPVSLAEMARRLQGNVRPVLCTVSQLDRLLEEVVGHSGLVHSHLEHAPHGQNEPVPLTHRKTTISMDEMGWNSNSFSNFIEALFDNFSPLLNRIALFAVYSGHAVSLACKGPFAQFVSGQTQLLADVALFNDVVRTRKIYRGPISLQEDHLEILSPTSRRWVLADTVLIPVILADNVVLIVFGDPGDSKFESLDLQLLQRLAQEASRQIVSQSVAPAIAAQLQET